MIDWNYIHDNFPKSWNKLNGETGETQVWIMRSTTCEPVCRLDNNSIVWNDRFLYDFFDKEEIYCWVRFIGEKKVGKYKIKIFEPMIEMSNYCNGMGEEIERDNAESVLWIKAFELLEEKLTK